MIVAKINRPKRQHRTPQPEKGFNLVELIIGIAMLAIAMTIMTGFLAPMAKQSAEPVVQLRATQLGQALVNEILSRSFDENSDRSPPWLRCGETGADPCTAAADLGPDSGESRTDFDDVDDFICTGGACTAVTNSLGNQPGYYQGFSVTINVIYDDNYDGQYLLADDNQALAKLITVTISSSTDDLFHFQVYKGNF